MNLNMKNIMSLWIVFLKSIILSYCMFLYASSKNFLNSIGYVIIFMLFYVSLSLLIYILKDSRLKIILKTLILVLVVSCCVFLSKFFILLFPISIIDIFNIDDKKYITYFIIMFSLIFVYLNEKDVLGIYIFIVISTIVYFELVYYSFNKIIKLTAENDMLKEKNYGLRASIDRKKEFEEQMMYTSRLEERNEISQEMHDKLGHSISASMLQLEASKMLIGKDNDRACGMIQNSIENLREGMNGIRRTLKNIKPSSNEMGINKVKLLLDKFKSSSAIAVHLMYSSGDIERIDYGMWSIIYENINEALTNVLKYSKANKVVVNIEVLNKIVKVEVKDNGIGAANVVKGLGITGMEERTQSAGGKIITDGGDGFSVITILPI